MSILTQNNTDEKALLDCIQRFFTNHHVGKILKKCNGTKEKSVPAVSLLRYKLGNIFVERSMYMQQRTGFFKEDFSKNTFYRFLNSTKTNRLRFTSLLAADIVSNDIKDLTDESRKNVFIIDDSLFNRSSCKKTELASKVFDHTSMRFEKGYRMLTLSWSDGTPLIPVNSCLLASSKESNIIGPVKAFDKRTPAGKRRALAQKKAPEAMMDLLASAKSAELTADYVLFDSWFFESCTDTSLSEEEIIRIYGRRWQIEVFFKTCKSMLNLIGECHSLSYDALTAHVAIVFTRYMLLSMEQRQNEDQRTLGELFFFLVDEMADITFCRSLSILMDALLASLQEILKLSDAQLAAFTTDFEARLPKYIQKALHQESLAA